MALVSKLAKYFSWSTAERVKIGDVVGSTLVLLIALLLPPEAELHRRKLLASGEDWPLVLGLNAVLFLITFVAGLISAFLFYRTHDFAKRDPFCIRAWWSLISGLVALPICLIFRPCIAWLAFLAFIFGAGPVAAHRVFVSFRKP